ncbi:Smr/MutS family protein [Psychroserpens sp. XS_ASV72]|uniref:Smr/MutS family protein n=1 Tax=Psychroserpens sp. XS_ASV72 TaxID=3241293 RepID=UPI003515FCFA
MKFKKGDKVSVLDEDISGTVVDVEADTIAVESSDGFVLQFRSNELVKESRLSSEQLNIRKIKDVIQEKEQSRKKPVNNRKTKDRSKPAMEVDLHIHKLTDHEHRMTSHDKLTLQVDTAKRQLEFAMRKHIQKIVFIHGVGEGVLKMELETLFRRYDNVKFYDADLQKYGFGATEVYIYQNVRP